MKIFQPPVFNKWFVEFCEQICQKNMRFSDLKKRILTLMDTEKRIQRFSNIIIAEFGAKIVHENKWFCEHANVADKERPVSI